MKRNPHTGLFLTPRVADEVRRETLEWCGRETGGLWLGRFDEAGNYIVSDFIGAGPKAEHRFASFSPDDDFQNRELAAKRTTSPGINVIAMWHSHPGWFSTPSSTDETAAISVIKEWGLGRPEVIVGIAIAPGREFSMRAFHMTAESGSFQEVAWHAAPAAAARSEATWLDLPGAERYLRALVAGACARGFVLQSRDVSSIGFYDPGGQRAAFIAFPAHFPFAPARLEIGSRRMRLPIDADLAGRVLRRELRRRRRVAR